MMKMLHRHSLHVTHGKNLKSRKMKYLKAYTLSALAILMASCSENDTIETSNEKTPSTSSMSFTASIDGKVTGDINGKATRTTLSNTDNPYPIWSSGDQIKVFNSATNDAQLFSISADGVGQRAATFTGEINVASSGNKYYAVYSGGVAGESAPTISLSGNNAVVSGNIPSTQSTTAGFHPELHFMTACTETSAFKFKNAMALMAVTIADNNYGNFEICKIVLKSNNANEKIAGDFTATIGNNGTLTNYSVTNGSSEITIGNGTTPLAVGTYYIAILPCAFSDGFTLSYLDERLDVNNDPNCKQYDRIKSTSFNVAASEIINLGTYTAQECAKEAYVDLGLTRTIDGVSKKILFCIENVYDDETGKTSDVNASYYAWGETYVKANQTKDADCQNYSWYYSYGIGQGSSNDDITYNMDKRSYKFGLGIGGLLDAWDASDRYNMESGSNSGVLLKYNDHSQFGSGSITDWGSGVKDGKRELDLEDDAAYQKSPNHVVRMPAQQDFEELLNSLKSGALVSGDAKNMTGFRKFKNKTTGNYILLTKGGYRYKSSSSGTDDPQETNSNAYWTRTRVANVSYRAVSFYSHDVDAGRQQEVIGVDRCQGRMIRGVIYR